WGLLFVWVLFGWGVVCCLVVGLVCLFGCLCWVWVGFGVGFVGGWGGWGWGVVVGVVLWLGVVRLFFWVSEGGMSWLLVYFWIS
ncbi:hypothetical protein, partial [Neisseria sp. P0022.S010]|uniref:hypothetical protein n=1 Tax=Neisseria sp. P0022.S010 TaxID=3436835 RepID=UPI003F7D7491